MDTMTPTVEEESPRIAIVRRWQVSSPKEKNSPSAKVVTRWYGFVRIALQIFAVGRAYAEYGRYLKLFAELKKTENKIFDAAKGKWCITAGARRRAAGVVNLGEQVRGAPQALAAAGAFPSKHKMTRAEYRERTGRLY